MCTDEVVSEIKFDDPSALLLNDLICHGQQRFTTDLIMTVNTANNQCHSVANVV